MKRLMDDLLRRGLTFKEAVMLMEAISSCAIEGNPMPDEKMLDRLCKKIRDAKYQLYCRSSGRPSLKNGVN